VIVAGAGPVGLTLAIDLGRRGARCLLIERSPTTLPYPKMDRSNARTMEFYRRIGIADRVRALGYPADNPMDVFLTTRLSDPPIAVLKPFKDLPSFGRLAGYAGPPDRRSAEVISKYIIVDMYAKAIQGMPAEEAAKWAHSEVVKAYA